MYISLMRHGAVQTPDLFAAPPNEPLSEMGWQQMHQSSTKNQQTYGNWEQIISSPAIRCADFAKQLAQQTHTPLQLQQDCQEMNFGDWQGINRNELWEKHPTQLQQLWQQPLRFTAPNGESMQQFQQRIQSFWQQLMTHTKQPNENKHYLMITHAGVIRLLMSYLLDMPHEKSLNIQLNHACYITWQIYHDGGISLVELYNPQKTLR